MKNKERNKKANFSIKDFKYKLRKYYDKRWKKVCLILVLILILNSIIFLFSGKNLVEKGIKRVLYTAGIYTEEIRNVSVASNDFENDIDGGIQIIKESRWTSLNTAEIKITLESKIKEIEGTKKDIVVLLNANNSLNGVKMNRLRESFSDLLDYTLRSKDNRISLVTFNDKAVVNSEFTNSKDQFLNAFDNIELNDKRSYRVGLNALRTFLSDYQETDKELVVLFIVDGYDNIETSSCLLEYNLLKKEQPNSKIKGITYEVGAPSKTGIQEISDSQYFAEHSKFEEKLFEAAVDPLSYENLEITDLIHDEYFYLENEEDVSYSAGKVTLTEENGATKIIWNMDGLKTGRSEVLTLSVKTKEERQNEVGFFPTNKKEEATYKIEGDEVKKVTSSLTPVLKNGYILTYDTNPPTGCNIKKISTEVHNAFSLVTKITDTLSCPGYTFKGWETEEDLVKVNDDLFIMAEHNTNIRAVWTKMSISKSMEGTINIKYNLPFNDEEAFLDNEASSFVKNREGIIFSSPSSSTNGKGLYVRAGTENDPYPIMYYRGNVENNNVLFAGMCWKIVRTTETGGTKLIYNGLSNNGVCNLTGEATTLGRVKFNEKANSLSDSGYMYGERYESEKYTSVDVPSVIYSTDVSWDGTKYTLNMSDSYTATGDWNVDGKKVFEKYRYTCGETSTTSCEQVYYIIYQTKSDLKNNFSLILNNGKKIENVIPDMFPDNNDRNKNESTIKKTIDEWYKNNLIEYTDYFEDTVWCNNRNISNTGLWFNSTTEHPNNSLEFGLSDYTSGKIKDEDICPNLYDRFTVSSEKGNKMLTYPVAILNSSEFILSGVWTNSSGKDSYLIDFIQWTMTPDGFTNETYISRVTANGMLDTQRSSYTAGLRPSISLKAGIIASRGNGSQNNPYVVE